MPLTFPSNPRATINLCTNSLNWKYLAFAFGRYSLLFFADLMRYWKERWKIRRKEDLSLFRPRNYSSYFILQFYFSNIFFVNSSRKTRKSLQKNRFHAGMLFSIEIEKVLESKEENSGSVLSVLFQLEPDIISGFRSMVTSQSPIFTLKYNTNTGEKCIFERVGDSKSPWRLFRRWTQAHRRIRWIDVLEVGLERDLRTVGCN